MDHLQEAKHQLEQWSDEGTRRAIAHTLIAIAEMLQGSIKAGTIQVDATLWNGSYPIQTTEDDSL